MRFCSKKELPSKARLIPLSFYAIIMNVLRHKSIGDIMTRKRKVNPEIIKKMKRLRRNGMSYNKIANRLGLSVMTVYNYLKKKEKVGFVDKLKQKLGLR